MRRRVLLPAAVVSLATGGWLLLASDTPAAERAAGVSRGAGGAVEIRYVLCGSQRVHFVRLLDYGESYGNGEVGPVLWQIHSRRGAPLRRVVVGRIPPGFDEEVNRLPLPGPSRLTVVTDAQGDDIMSFRLRELRRERVYRADYVYVTPRAFVRRGKRDCGTLRRARRYQVASYPFLAFGIVGVCAAFATRLVREWRKMSRH